MSQIGRDVKIGLASEAARGTTTAAQFWIPHLASDFVSRYERIDNESAMGVMEKTNDSELIKRWAEGSLEGKVAADSIGVILLAGFGAVTTTDNVDTNAAVKDHTFNISSDNTGETLTFVRKHDFNDERYGMATIDSLEIMAEESDWVKFNIGFLSKDLTVGGTNTPAYSTTEAEFTSKHVVVAHAANVAGLASPTNLTVKSVKLNISRNAELYFAHGSVEPNDITSGEVEITGELVLRYDDDTLRDYAAADTKRALRISIVNTDVTIGASARPGLVITMPKVSFDWSLNQDIASQMEQTVAFTAHLSASDAYAIRAVLTNTVASY